MASEPRIIPSPGDLLAELEEMRQIALNRIRAFRQRGVVVEHADPDVKAAVSCTLGKAALLGYMRQTAQIETRDVIADAMRRTLGDPELRAMLLEELKRQEPALLGETKECREDTD